MMRSPWHDEKQHVSREERLEQQVLLGRFMERSTSAPPVTSDQYKFNGGAGSLIEDSELFFRNNNEHNEETGFFIESGRDSAPLMSTSLAFIGGLEDDGGRSTAPLTYADTALSNALLGGGIADSQSAVPRGSSLRHTSLGFGHFNRHPLGEKSPLEDEPHFVRSRSAAPTFLSDTSRVAPPPGLSPAGVHLREMIYRDPYGEVDAYGNDGLRRATSAGPIISERDTSSSVLDSLGLGSIPRGSDAVRPAPKTLMDLIKEDSPPPFNHGGHFSSYNGNNADHIIPPPRSHTAGPSFERNGSMYTDRSKTTSPLDTYSNDISENRRVDGYYQPETMGYKLTEQQEHGTSAVTQHMERLQIGKGGQQFVVGMSHSRIDQGRSAQYTSVPVTQQGPRGISPLNQYQEPVFPEHNRTQKRAVFAQSHPSQYPQSTSSFDGQTVYYTGNPQLTNVVVDQPTAFTTAVLPNGQTIYLNTSQLSYAPTHPMTYQPHVIHQQVIPMHATGHVAFYQGVDGASVSPQVILNQPVARSRGLEPSQGQGRTKDSDRAGKSAPKGRRGGSAPTGSGGGRRDDARCKQSTISPLLDEFRTTKNRDWTILDITGHVMEFCQDQNGSRFIQQRLEVGNTSEQQVVMAEVLPAVRQLRIDVFGNYVVQKLLEFGTPQMKVLLRDTLSGEMLPLSLHMYGCRVVQKALETLDEDDLPKLLIEFHDNVLSCIHDQNGNHVIQKCIEVMSIKAKHAYASHDGERATFFGEQIDFVINDVLNNVASLSCHPYGCRVLQRILEHCVEPKKLLALNEIAKCHKLLLDDQYGNYVIQHVLQYGRHQDRESIMHIVIANGILPLSKQKFASNVVEKLLKYGTPAQRNRLVREMLVIVDDQNSGGTSVVLLMVRDAYANYVVQTTLDVISEGEEKTLLLEELNTHSAQLRQYTFAKHIVTKLSS